MSASKVEKYFQGNEDKVAKQLREGITLPEIMQSLNVNEPKGSNIRAGFTRVITRHPVLSKALEDRISEIVSENETNGKNTSINELGIKTGDVKYYITQKRISEIQKISERLIEESQFR